MSLTERDIWILRATVFKAVVCLCFAFIFIPISSQAQDCSLSQDINILDFGTTQLELDVSGLINDDLSSDQALCGVRIVFEHERLENIRITLTSPSGQTVTLVGPGRINATPTPFIDWNILFNDCATANMPDAGIGEVWDNGGGWASFSDYNGTYDPHNGCLEDFNTGSANGTWTLDIENLGEFVGLIQYFELIFCDPEGIDCEPCLVFPGDYEFESPGGVISLCEGEEVSSELLTVNRLPELQTGQSYAYVLRQDDSIIEITTDPVESAELTSGDYQICGLVYDVADENFIFQYSSYTLLEADIADNLFCAGLTDNCLTLRVLPVNESILYELRFCEGDTLEFRGIDITTDFDTILYFPDTSQVACDSIVEIMAFMITLDAEITSSTTEIICGESVFLNALQSTSNLGIDAFMWETANGTLVNDIGPVAEVTGPGMYELILTSDICMDTAIIEITSVDSFLLDIEIENAFCVGDSNVINIMAPQGTSYAFDSNDFIAIDDNSYYSFEEGVFNLEASLGTCIEDTSFQFVIDADEIELLVEVDSINCKTDVATVDVQTNIQNATFRIEGPLNFETGDNPFEIDQPGIYSIEVFDDSGCSASDEFEIIADFAEPVFTVEDIEVDCNTVVPGFNLVLSSPVDSVNWIGPSNYSSNDINAVPVFPGNYEFTVYGQNGCTGSGSADFMLNNVEFEINVLDEPIDCINNVAEICVESPLVIDSIVWGFMNMQETTDDCFVATEGGDLNILVFSGTCATFEIIEVIDEREEIEYELSLSDGSLGCTTDSIVASLILPDPSIIDYEWFLDGNNIGSNEDLIITQPGNYSFEITDLSSFCVENAFFEIELDENSLSEFAFDLVQPNCFPEPGILNLTGLPTNTVFGIFLNEEVLDFRDLPNLELAPGLYELEIIDEFGCSVEADFEVFEGSRVELNLGDDITTIPLIPIQLNAISNLSSSEISELTWTVFDSISCLNCLNPEYYPLQSQIISLEIVDENGCVATDSLLIDISEEKIFYIPNIFTPNNDGSNDDLEIYLSDAINAVFELRIFDRWGNLLLFRPEISGDTSNFVWDGYFNGEEAEIGVYTYMAKLLLIDGSERQIFGQVTLLR